MKVILLGDIKGVGPATAKKIVNTFGKDTINVIKLEPQKLTQIKGISKEKALEITEQFVANWEIWQIVGFLEKKPKRKKQKSLLRNLQELC